MVHVPLSSYTLAPREGSHEPGTEETETETAMCRETERQLSPQLLVGELQSRSVGKARPQGMLGRGKDGGRRNADQNDTKQAHLLELQGRVYWTQHCRLSVTVMA